MRFGRLLPAVSALFAVGALVALTGAAAAATSPERAAPTASPAAASPSLALGKGPLVVQRGLRNYAGPTCPGKGWNCTTSTRVMQVSLGDGENKVECTEGSVITGQSCVIVQTGEHNVAKCYQRSDSDAAVQHCSITQTGASNKAQVHQRVYAKDGDEQTATQTAVVKQTSSGGSNESSVQQDVKQKAKGGDSQEQDVQQSAVVEQDAVGSGENQSRIHQDQHLQAKGSASSQRQNTKNLGVADCSASGFATPNACANVNQSSIDGDNDSHIKQSIKEDARTNVDASQWQGTYSGGIAGRVHQDTVTGTSTNKAKQDKDQRASAPDGSFQLQYDPIYCCGVTSQVGGLGNSEDIDQSSVQEASEAHAAQLLALLGDSRSPTGSCSVSQQARNNSDSTTNGASIAPCPFLQVFTSCTNGGSFDVTYGIAEEHEGAGDPLGSCTATPPVTVPPECVFCVESAGGQQVRLKRE